MKVALLGVLPIVLGYLVIFWGLRKSAALEPSAGFMIIKFIFSQGIGEEVVFRGLIFRHLRRGRSFWPAASLSGLLFAFIHLINLAKGVTPELLIAVATSIAFGFILTFPLALLFELGGGSILGGAIFHVAIDSVNWFTEAGESGAPMNTYLGFVLIAAIVVTLAALKTKISLAKSSSRQAFKF